MRWHFAACLEHKENKPDKTDMCTNVPFSSHMVISVFWSKRGQCWPLFVRSYQSHFLQCCNLSNCSFVYQEREAELVPNTIDLTFFLHANTSTVHRRSGPNQLLFTIYTSIGCTALTPTGITTRPFKYQVLSRNSAPSFAQQAENWLRWKLSVTSHNLFLSRATDYSEGVRGEIKT